MSINSTSSVPLNAAILYELALINNSDIIYRISNMTRSIATYFIEVSDRLLNNKIQISGLNKLFATSHRNFDYYRMDIHHEFNRAVRKFITYDINGSPSLAFFDFAEWYKENNKRLRHIHIQAKRFVFAFGPYLLQRNENTQNNLKILDNIACDIVGIGMTDCGIIKMVNDRGIMYKLSEDAIVESSDDKCISDRVLHELPSVYLPSEITE